MSGRTAFRDGEADAQQFGRPDWKRYGEDVAYTEGFEAYMKEHPLPKQDWTGRCRECGAEIPLDELSDWSNPLCVRHRAEKGGGNDPETQSKEE